VTGKKGFSLGEYNEIRMGFDGGVTDEWLREHDARTVSKR
jgi:hypothetical protein